MRLSAHGHVITLTHLTRRAFVICSCGTGSTVMEEQFVGEWITRHRTDNFGIVKYRLNKC